MLQYHQRNSFQSHLCHSFIFYVIIARCGFTCINYNISADQKSLVDIHRKFVYNILTSLLQTLDGAIGWGAGEWTQYGVLGWMKGLDVEHLVSTIFSSFSTLGRCARHPQGSHSSWKTWKNGDSFSSLEKSWNFFIFAKYPGKMRQTLEI